MKIALGQVNPIIGDLKGNSALILKACQEAYQQKADLLITPELSLWGYPPKDLLLNSELLKEQWPILQRIVKNIAKKTPGLILLIGIAESTTDFKSPSLFNSIVLVDKKGWKVIARKQLLPTYDVFDEKRYFRASDETGQVSIVINEKPWNIGITICEDIWVKKEIQGHQIEGPDPLSELEKSHIDLLINLSASPFTHRKEAIRHKLAASAAKRLNCPVAYVNQIGGNDELIFDGASFVVNEKGKLVLTLPHCQELISTWDSAANSNEILISPQDPQETLLEALVLGAKDYSKKCGFKSALIGLSGGIDSALVATIAVAALGHENVSAVLMPSPWSSMHSVKDAKDLAKRLCIQTNTIPIDPLMKSYDNSLEKALGELPMGLTAENLQARIRGTLLMAIANKQEHLLLATGNKSELAVGYCTLYGDMNGGLSVIGDLYKTSVFKLCNWIDSDAANKCKRILGLPVSELIGSAIRHKLPSAELRPGQLDSDSLPEYDTLDAILKVLIEKRGSVNELLGQGYELPLIRKIQKLLKQSEFKRKQAPPMLKVSNQAFGSGWRVPIAASYFE